MNPLLRRFKSKKPKQQSTFVAVDFDSRKMRLVHAKRSRSSISIRGIDSFDLPADLDTADPKATGSFLLTCLKKMRLSRAGIIMSVPRAKAILKPLTLPGHIDQSELATMVRFQARKELPFEPDEAVIDFTITPHHRVSDNKSESEATDTLVLLAAVKTEVVDYYRQVAEAAQAKLQRLGLRPYANTRTILTADQQAKAQADSGPSDADDTTAPRGLIHHADDCTVLVNIATNEAEIDILVGWSLQFSREIPIKHSHDLEDDDEHSEHNEAFDDTHALSTSETVVREVERSINSFMQTTPTNSVITILIAGATGIEDEVRSQLAQRTIHQCRLFDPPLTDQKADKSTDESLSAFTAALGLAYGQSGTDEPPFDFLHPKKPVPKVDYRNHMKAGGIAVAAIVLLGIIFWGWQAVSNKQAEVNDLRTRYNEADKLNRDVKVLAKRVQLLESWSDQDTDWLSHWTYLSHLLPAPTEMYVKSVKTDLNGSMSVSLRARDASVIADIGERLNKAGYEFRPGPISTTKDNYGYNYTTDMKITPTKKVKIDWSELSPPQRPTDDASTELFGKRR